MHGLAPRDRRGLLEKLEHIADTTPGQSGLVERAQGRLAAVPRDFPFRHGLEADLMRLLHFLTTMADQKIHPFEKRRLERVCRGALLVFLREGSTRPCGQSDRGLYDDARILNCVAAELARVSGKESAPTREQLSAAEKEEAERILIEMAGKPLVNGTSLLQQAARARSSLEQFAEFDFIQTLSANAARLENLFAQMLANPDTNQEDYVFRIALGALRYLIEPCDLIPDRYGPIGLLDDAHVLQCAMYLITKNCGLDWERY